MTKPKPQASGDGVPQKTTPTPALQEPPILHSSFVATLQEMRRGAVIGEASDFLAQCVTAVRVTGKTGKLKLELTIKPASKGDTDTLMVTAEVSGKLPKPEARGSIFYPTDDGGLLREDPRQGRLPLGVLEGGKEQTHE